MPTLTFRNASHNATHFRQPSKTLTFIKAGALSLLIPREINNDQSLKIIRFFPNLIINGFFGTAVDSNDDRLHVIYHRKLLVSRIFRISIDKWNHWQAPL